MSVRVGYKLLMSKTYETQRIKMFLKKAQNLGLDVICVNAWCVESSTS